MEESKNILAETLKKLAIEILAAKLSKQAKKLHIDAKKLAIDIMKARDFLDQRISELIKAGISKKDARIKAKQEIENGYKGLR